MKKCFYFTILFSLCIFSAKSSLAEINLTQKLAGRILLQVEHNGEAWYLNPADEKRYYLARPSRALALMKNFGLGISNLDLEKIPLGLIENNNTDTDGDGLADDLEIAIATDINSADTDNDGYNDWEEVLNGHNPLSKEKNLFDSEFSKKQSGKILLQVEKNGEAWYVNPGDTKRYFLGRPNDALNIMKSLGLGISNLDIIKIPIDYVYEEPTKTISPERTIPANPDILMSSVASSIRKNDLETLLPLFTTNMQTAVKYTMNFLNKEQRLTLANILSDTKLSNSSETKKTYSTKVYFNSEKHTINFYVEKQSDDSWLLTNL